MSNFKTILNVKLIICPITTNVVARSQELFGQSIPDLKGKTVRSSSRSMDQEIMSISHDIIHYQNHVTLFADIIFVSGVIFLITTSWCIKFRTVQIINNKDRTTMVKTIKRSIQIYRNRGFKFTMVLMDGEFWYINDGNDEAFNSITVNTVPPVLPEDLACKTPLCIFNSLVKITWLWG